MNIKQFVDMVKDLPQDTKLSLSKYMVFMDDEEIGEDGKPGQLFAIYDIPILGFGIDEKVNEIRFIVDTSSGEALSSMEKEHKIIGIEPYCSTCQHLHYWDWYLCNLEDDESEYLEGKDKPFIHEFMMEGFTSPHWCKKRVAMAQKGEHNVNWS